MTGNSQEPVLRLGVIADIQYCDCETYGSRFYRSSLLKLEAAVTNLNAEKVQFTVNLGDLVDRDTPANLEAVIMRLNRLKNPVYNLTGNHDYEGIQDMQALYTQLGMPSSYYSFSQSGWRFVFLNTNDISSYTVIKDSPEEEELNAMMEKIKISGHKNGASYNGGIGEKQIQWLRKELILAGSQNERVLIFSHHPLYAAPGLTALNDQEIVELITEYPQVKACISGHHHPGDFGEYKGVAFITTEGMVETENKNAFGVIEIYNDCIEFIGKGRSRSYTIKMGNNSDSIVSD